MRQALGLVEEGKLEPSSGKHPPLEALARLGTNDAAETLAKMRWLEAYWESGAAEDGGRYDQVVGTVRPGLYGPSDVSLRFVPGVSFPEWCDGATPLSLVAEIESEAAQPGVGSSALSLVVEVAAFRVLCPSATEEQAQEWVGAVAWIRAKKAARGKRRGAAVASGLSRTTAEPGVVAVPPN